jgi:enoyl-CoA hydratase/carnithine racemase
MLTSLNSWDEANRSGDHSKQADIANSPHGFGSISRRNNSTAPRACKPLIAAVNGGAYGGGLELALGCDMIVCGEDAKFALPEVKRGVVAAQGGQRASACSLAV